MRRLILTALLILAAAAALPAVIGIVVVRQAPGALVELDELLDGVAITRPEIRSGWLRTRIECAVVPDGGSPAALTVKVAHGPWLAWPPLLASLRATAEAPAGPLLTARATVSPGLGLWLEVRPAPGQGQGAAELRLARRGREGSLEATALTIAGVVEGLAGSARFAARDGDASGGGDFALGSLDLPAARLAAGRLKLRFETAGQDLAVEASFHADQLRPGEGVWQDVMLAMALRRLHLPTLSALADGLRSLHEALPAGAERDQALGNTAALALPALLANRPEIERLDFSALAPAGPLEFTARARLVAAPPPAFLAEPDRLYEVTELEVEASAAPGVALALAGRRLDPPWAGALDPALRAALRQAVLDDLVDAGTLVFDGTRYQLSVDHGPEGTRVNGAPGSLPLAL